MSLYTTGFFFLLLGEGKLNHIAFLITTLSSLCAIFLIICPELTLSE